MKILDTTKNTICAQYEKDDAVCPPNLRNGLFTTSAVFNIDHNTSSTYSKENFHGTGISLFQHPSIEGPGVDRNVLSENLDYKTPKMGFYHSMTLMTNHLFQLTKTSTLISQRKGFGLEHVNDNLKGKSRGKKCNFFYCITINMIKNHNEQKNRRSFAYAVLEI